MACLSVIYRYLLAKAPPTFPPPTSETACGFNFALLEDILCGIQARMCLYLLTPETGKQCQIHLDKIQDSETNFEHKNQYMFYFLLLVTGFAARALSSIDVENSHSIINHLDRKGVQTSTIEELSRHVSTLQRLQILRKSPIGRFFRLRYSKHEMSNQSSVFIK